MKFISDSSYSELDKQILHDEYIDHIKKVRSFNELTPFYVYALCFPNGEPFYVGKGKNYRAWDHLKEYIYDKSYNASKHNAIGACIDPPIMFIIEGNLDEKTAYEREKILVEYYGRNCEGGQLTNVMPGGIEFSNKLLCSEAGKLGGRITKDNKLGIFSESYDRGKQTKFNFSSGLMDHVDFREIGRLGGEYVVENKLGIHNPIYSHLRKEWASNAAKISILNGFHGPASKEWRESHPEYKAKGSKESGTKTGNLPWWNNGKINKRSELQPGEDFKRGQLQSEKKLQAIRDSHARRKLNSKKVNNE